MKAELEVAKRGRKCSYCGNQIEKDEKFIFTTDWIPQQKFPATKNICFGCLRLRIDLIPVLENILMDLRVLKRTNSTL